MSNNLLVIYARMPETGKVKTRLAATLGDEKALALYTLFLNETMRIALSVHDTRTRIDYTPESHYSRKFFKAAFRGVPLLAQRGTDLGDRLTHSFAEAFTSGFQKVCIIGSDSPDLPASYIEQGFAMLNENNMTLGPSLDGGYYLIGLRKPTPELFINMPWSEPGLARETVKRAVSMGLDVATLPPWCDVDDGDDLEHLRNRLSHTWDKQLLVFRTSLEECLNT